jgi:predicted nucleotidyltransferase
MNPSIQTKSELLTLLFNHKDTIKSFGVKELGLFGSFVSGEGIKNDSDIDFLIEFYPEKKNYDNFIGLTFFLEELTGRKIELVTRKSLSPYIGPHILKQVEHVGI